MKRTTIAIAIGSVFLSSVSMQAHALPETKEQKIELKLKKTAEQTPKLSSESKDQEVEQISVTGSRLKKRDAFSQITPMMAIGSESIEDSGIGSLSEILIDEIPSLDEGVSNLNSGSSVQNSGLSTVNMRRLGVDRTLTLIDGRRAVSNSYSGNYVSTSTIPSGMVERTEIISGGASAIYGSDAIAGVVNIITRKDKEGLEIEARAGGTTDGGDNQLSLQLNYGTEFAGGLGYLYFASDFEREYGLKWSDRKRAQIEADYDYNTTLMCNEMATATGDQCMRDITHADWRSRSDGIKGGVFEESSGSIGGYWYDANGLRSDWAEEQYGVNSKKFDYLKTPSDALASALKVSYELTDDVEAQFHVQFSSTRSDNVKSPEDENESSAALYIDPVTGVPSQVTPGAIPIDNPYAPQEIVDIAGSSISWDRRFFEVGNVTTDNERATLRTWTGLNGTAFDGEWDWDITLGYGRFKQSQTRLNELNVIKLRHALNAEFAEDGVTIQCKDADARAQGCVPVNLFGEGSITAEAADWIRANPTITTRIEQINLVGYMAGDLFDLPAGAVTSAFGFEYRKDTQDVATSNEQQYGGVTFNVVPTFKGSISVGEVFGEVSVPVLRDAYLAKSLGIEASLRLADYDIDSLDLISSYRFGGAWQPVEGYSIRLNYARAQRAPNITELMSPARGDFDSFDDICDEVTATSTGSGHDNCRAEPAIAALLAANPGLEFEDENNSYSPNAGNRALKEETADTYTAGISIEPSFVDDLQIAVDYYDITIKDAIDEISNQQTIAQCYESSLGIENNPFCDSITRNEEGQIIELLQRQYNLNEVSTRGVDTVVRYKYDLEDYGRLSFSFKYNHVIDYITEFEGNDGIETLNSVGELDSGIFKDKASLSVSWKMDDWRVRWSTSYRGKVVDSFAREQDYFDALAENQVLIDAGSPDAVNNPEQPLYLYLGSYTKHNVAVTKKFRAGDTKIKITGGVRNVFNNLGEFIPASGDVESSAKGNSSSKYGGGVGRYIYLGTEISF